MDYEKIFEKNVERVETLIENGRGLPSAAVLAAYAQYLQVLLGMMSDIKWYTETEIKENPDGSV